MLYAHSHVFHIGLIVLIATTLSAAQFFVELRKCSNSESHRPPSSYEDAEEPLLERDSAPLAMKLMPAPRMSTRPRSKSKPDGIFIHPQHNNIARADAAALELGLGGTTDRVAVPAYEHTGAPWQHDQGRQQARALLGQASDGRDAHAFGLAKTATAPNYHPPLLPDTHSCVCSGYHRCYYILIVCIQGVHRGGTKCAINKVAVGKQRKVDRRKTCRRAHSGLHASCMLYTHARGLLSTTGSRD
ncbi:hypothetical protein BD626DRAFT_193159 [Schizophyllum amplum]|uniref:Secreted protein n=1 Tax=Schizophyllum amplum TaxID=97359 RepID=A0A550CM58_9AGAR|nr:hypothetical protein BD626DRAFT_193159 [Auriculariopsis ampla]